MNTKFKIEKLDHFARGISYLDNKVIFIENALPGEEVLVNITNNQKKYLEGSVTKYLTISNKRIKPECPYYESCGGCNISHINSQDELKFKEETFISTIKRNCNLDINPIVIESPKTKYYRNKITLKIENNKWGYYQNKTHNFTEIDNCLIAKESINKIINNKNLFNIKNGEIIIRSNYNDEILINISSDFKVEIDIPKLRKESKIVGILVNNKIIHGADSFIEVIDKYFYKVSINSFFQINLDILNEVFKIISKDKYNNIIDLYCGVGTLGISVNKNKLYGVENSISSVKNALTNASLNKQNNNYYLLGDSTKIKEIKDTTDMLLIDPPRSGISNKTINHIMESDIKDIIYMSCNIQTLARDLNILKEKYIINETYLLNMFPQTYHFECLVKIKKI